MLDRIKLSVGLLAAGLACSARSAPQHKATLPVPKMGWHFAVRHRVSVLQTPFAPVVYYAPRRPQRILVLAFGYPWDEVPDATILAYDRVNVRQWSKFAEENNTLIVAPVLGGQEFLDYRTLSGKLISPDKFVDDLIDGPATKLVPGAHGKFCIHGHSAGAQFTARFVIMHPERLECAYLSAPSTYAMPNMSVKWPFGMGRPTDARQPYPRAETWLAAATSAPIEVIVGSNDTERRPADPSQVGDTRLDRGRAWVAEMQSLATQYQMRPHVHFSVIPGVAHEEEKMAVAAQAMLHAFYTSHKESSER